MTIAEEFFELSHFKHRTLFPQKDAAWEALDRLEEYLAGFF